LKQQGAKITVQANNLTLNKLEATPDRADTKSMNLAGKSYIMIARLGRDTKKFVDV